MKSTPNNEMTGGMGENTEIKKQKRSGKDQKDRHKEADTLSRNDVSKMGMKAVRIEGRSRSPMKVSREAEATRETRPNDNCSSFASYARTLLHTVAIQLPVWTM